MASKTTKPTAKAPLKDTIITFLRRRDFKFKKELGQGACGQTVLLFDDQIDEHFVCKKYVPYDEDQRPQLFNNFVREIKLLHKIHHVNVVRVFNYYIYPEIYSGYILMEYVDGEDIVNTVGWAPETINQLFPQAIAGFQHLEKENILHRDIRPANILVRSDGILKIIDLGFGKGVQDEKDFDKSISLNLWCDPPKEFASRKYDFTTEVYFVGKLFEQIIESNQIEDFQFRPILKKMCQLDPKQRIQSFFDIDKEIQNGRFGEIEFSKEEITDYRAFAEAISRQITKIEKGAKYRDDLERIQIELENTYRSVMLEDEAPDSVLVTRCLINGTYYYKAKGFPVVVLKGFMQLLKAATVEQKRIILANLHTRLDKIPRYAINDAPEDDIPF